MRATVVRLTKEGACEARTENALLLVFTPPTGSTPHLNDVLAFDQLSLDSNVSVTNVTRGQRFMMHIAAHNVHDLRLPSGHGTSRVPSEARIRES